MRVLALDPDLIVFISAFWQTTCTAVRAADEGFVIDSPVLPHELEALPRVLEQSNFPVSGLLVTHADWDHLLGRAAFPEASLGAGEPTVEQLTADPDTPQNELDDFDAEHYIERPERLSVSDMQGLPVPGRLEIGEREIEVHPAPGHTGDGVAYFAPWLGVLIPGDYLSPVEIPWISPNGSRDAYLETLERLRGLVERADRVVPGHGHPLERADALRIIDEDVRYLNTMDRLPPGRESAAQRKIHAENLRRIG